MSAVRKHCPVCTASQGFVPGETHCPEDGTELADLPASDRPPAGTYAAAVADLQDAGNDLGRALLASGPGRLLQRSVDRLNRWLS